MTSSLQLFTIQEVLCSQVHQEELLKNTLNPRHLCQCDLVCHHRLLDKNMDAACMATNSLRHNLVPNTNRYDICIDVSRIKAHTRDHTVASGNQHDVALFEICL